MQALKRWWTAFEDKHTTAAQFIVIFILSNGITVLQLVLMPAFKAAFAHTSLVDTAFLFDYPAGSMAVGGGGGLAYFLAVEITLLIAQVINFFAQRNVTFKSNSSVGKAAFWYAVAYVVITIAAAALQVLYKDPIYAWAISTMGAGGETVADVITMIINAAISFWVFFPIFKVIFK